MNSRASPGAARRAVIRGRVQGVWFRASTAERARALGLRGCAENRPDGSVLVVAAGEADALERLVEWLREGPPLARVDAVEVEAIDPGSHDWPDGFLAR